MSNILIVDDNAMNAKLLSLVLSLDGFQVRSARDAADAYETLSTFRPDLIVMDIQLPGVDGYELTQDLKADEKYRAIPVIAVTSYAMKGDREKAKAAGCDGYYTKPIDTRSFAGIVRRHLYG